MEKFEVCYISGNSLKYKKVIIEAENKDEAVDKAFEIEGHAFENRLCSVDVYRDCENCKNHTSDGCKAWECEFERR